MAGRLDLRRGPKVGDAASLWNFTPAPGWTKEEVFILKLCLQKHGVGRWVQILDTGLLPGKLIQQLNGQTQRLLGQQSLAAYTGLQVDVDRIRADNEAKTDVERKAGLIIWSGPNPTKQMKEEWRKEAKAKYGLTAEQLAEVEQQLQEIEDLAKDAAPAAALLSSVGGPNAAATVPAVNAFETPLDAIPQGSKVDVLHQLHSKLQELVALLEQHDITLSLPEGFAGFAAHRYMQSNALPTEMPEAADAAHVAEPDVLVEAPPANGGSTHVKKPAGKGPAARNNKGQNASGDAAKGGKRTSKAKKRKYFSSDSEDDAADDAAAAQATSKGRARANAALGSSGLIEELMGMGFTRSKARDALENCEGDMQAAIEWLVAHCVA